MNQHALTMLLPADDDEQPQQPAPLHWPFATLTVTQAEAIAAIAEARANAILRGDIPTVDPHKLRASPIPPWPRCKVFAAIRRLPLDAIRELHALAAIGRGLGGSITIACPDRETAALKIAAPFYLGGHLRAGIEKLASHNKPQAEVAE